MNIEDKNKRQFAINVGQLTKEKRLDRDLSIEKLAGLTGLGVQTIKDLENGKYNTHFYTFYLLADALGVTTDYFLQKQSGHDQSTEDADLVSLILSLCERHKKLIKWFANSLKTTGDKLP